MKSLEWDGPDGIYTRVDAERILDSLDVQPQDLDPLSLPVAGLRSISLNGSIPTMNEMPKELLPWMHQPIVIFDLDEIVWRHIWRVIRAMGQASGRSITMDYFRTIGNTRKIPEWKDPEIMAIHDEIILGKHPFFYPYVNEAYPEAVAGIQAQKYMGHLFAFLTARPAEVVPETIRALRWNNIPANDRQTGYVDALVHNQPEEGYVYGSRGLPMIQRTTEPKSDVVMHWLGNLRRNGWEGEFIVIDDILTSYRPLLASGAITGIALSGDVNAARDLSPGEIRVDSWTDIHRFLMDAHIRAVAADPSPHRTFHHDGRVLTVAKDASGDGMFRLKDIPESAYQWIESTDTADDIQGLFEHLGHA